MSYTISVDVIPLKLDDHEHEQEILYKCKMAEEDPILFVCSCSVMVLHKPLL